ncbi:MAG TPA: carboxypeptidase-like regulatory domain-containing protein [Candidatus Acidoferrales bacterium]|nr:carboxypeptidase-like regulatory domain-containing protein [Candidatus Acidoferrales bacterium]
MRRIQLRGSRGCTYLIAAIALAATLATDLSAQGIYATLTGIVTDPSTAVVAKAKVTLTDTQSGSQRDTLTNNDGYFTFASVPVGTYNVAVEAKGFVTYKVQGIGLGGGEKRNLDVSLQVGSTSQAVEVTGLVDQIAPVDSGEKSATLTTKELQNYVQTGSNAAEFIKIMPGFGIANGTSNKANYTGETIGINANGDAGSQSPLNNAYSYNGLPGNSLDITADGAHVSDPGCNCDTPVNPNSDMVEEFKVLTSNFSAENQKGPAVVTSVSKSGGHDFHGSAFIYARNYALNANDAQFNANGQPRPENKYYYPGGTIGGPVLIPGTKFNNKRNKLFFFTGYEYFYQVLDTGLLRATVPTPGMINGNFSPAELSKLGNITASGGPPGQINQATFPGGIIPSNMIDPNTQAMMKLYPQPNADSNSTGGYNYVQAETFNQNNVQWMARVDYSISDNTKLFVRYNLQRETQLFPVGLWWRNGGQVPYPTPVEGKNRSDSVSASLTHVFSPSMTNEVVFGYTFIGFPNVFEDPSKVDRTKVGYNYKGLFKNGVTQIPAFGGWGGGEAALIFNPGGFEAGGPSEGLYANKYMPSVSDTLTKVWGTHTIKGGFFWEWIRNAQPANNYTNGFLEFNVGNPNTTGSAYADELLGILNSYQETSFNRINDIAYNTYEGFVQDSWKVNRRLTIEYGLRFTHFQPWYDRLGYGYSIFDYSKYSPSCTPLQYCGFEWNKRNSAVPLGGFPTRALFYQPRFGVAYDVFGSGKTVLRGGWGRYYYHAGQFTNGLDVSAGVVSRNLGANVNGVPVLARNLDTLNVADQASSPSAVDSKDDRQAHTDSYSFTVSQRLPWSSLLEVAYVGNMTRDIPSSGNGGSAGFNTLNINLVPVGSMLASNNGGVDPNSLTADNFRPLKGFSDLYLATNNAYSNYNALQLTWVRTKGRYTINMNYTFGKAMGLVSFHDQFNLDNNYGVLPSNRTHIFNIAYSVELGNPVRDKLAGGFVNGWQLSGIVQAQSGANLSGFQNIGNGANFNMQTNGAKIPGTTFNISNASLLGTSDIALNPVLTCNPSSGLGTNQYINPNCFGMPTAIGQNGPTVLPAIYGPAFFNWDMGLFKNFQIKEAKKIQIRFNGYNFLNHPLWSFNGSNLTLGFDPSTGKVNTPLFGSVTQKQGHRVVQMALKFFF